MELNYLKDRLFDWLNDNSEELNISDIQTHERENTIGIATMKVEKSGHAGEGMTA